MSQFGNILDIDNYTDAASDVVDAAKDLVNDIHDAGAIIGGILKGISPALAFIPGLGTAFAVGVYAAGAISAKDPITDAVIGTTSAAMPPGLPRIAFDGASNITKDIAEGHNAFTSAVDACRKAAATSGPQAQAAFDAALNMARGGKIDSRLIQEAKANFANGGKTAEMAFDAGIAVANGEGADQVVLDVTRNYVRDVGGPLAAAGFDTGVALGYGQTLQQAGWAGLHTLVRGNNPVEMIIEFVKQVGFANAAGMAVPIFLQNGLVRDGMNALKRSAPTFPDFDKVKKQLEPLIQTFQEHIEALDIPSGQLAQEWGLDEALVRSAQSLVDRATGQIDQAFLDMFNMADAPGAKERNDALEKEGQGIAAKGGRLGLARTHYLFTRTPAWVRGFDIGLATAQGSTAFGPGQQKIRDSIPTEQQYSGFNAARDLTYASYTAQAQSDLQSASVLTLGASTKMSLEAGAKALTMVVSPQERASLVASAKQGAAMAAADSRLAAVRSLSPTPEYQWGFDVGTSVAHGSSTNGPGQDMICAKLGPLSYVGPGGSETKGSDAAMAGFRSAQALQFGITKGLGGGPPAITAGNLLVQGLSGGGFTSDQRAGVVSLAQNNAAVAAGANAAVAEKTGFFHKLAVFFGLA